MKNNFYCEHWTKGTKFCIEIEKKIHTEKSKFQKIDFYKSKEFGVFFTLDDLMMVNQKDEYMYHEMIVHPAFAVNPNIKKVLIIGGGDGGTAREASRYKGVEQIDMVEIDERVVRLSQKYLPTVAGALSKDKRIKLYFEDGVAFVKNSKTSTYDLVLIDSTDPISIGEGLFTTEFYKDIKRILTKDGIVINQNENAYFSEYAKNAKKAHHKLKAIFPITKPYLYQIPTYPSGLWMFSFSSKSFDPIKNLNAKKWNSLKMKTKYYNTDLHCSAFSLPNYIKDELK